MQRKTLKKVFYACAVAAAIAVDGDLCADEPSETQRQLRLLQEQNQALQQQLQQQQKLIDSLSAKVNEIQQRSVQPDRELEGLKNPEQESGAPSRNFSLPFGKVNISAEGGVAFFHSEHDGQFPHPEFRVDEAKLFIEAPIWKQVYFYSELNFVTREAADLDVRIGELYLDVENLSQLWKSDHALNLRLGRMDIPFGEEYINRDAIDNPLISHSLSDLWGVDEGIELYGKLGKFSYVVAVQNGGPSGIADFNSDKSVAGRFSYDPSSHLHMSVSGMRTGELKLPQDNWSELWFSGGWFLPFNSTNATEYHAELVEGDVEWRLPRGHLKAFGGYAHYDDNAPDADNERNIYYYSFEAIHDVIGKVYVGARFSQIFADNGYALVGHSDIGHFLFSGTLTEEIWRLSLGLGYRWSDNLLTKAEYTFQRGKEVGGQKREHEDLFGVEMAFKF